MVLHDKLVKFQLTKLKSGMKLVWFCPVPCYPKSLAECQPAHNIFRLEMRLSSLLYCLSYACRRQWATSRPVAYHLV